MKLNNRFIQALEREFPELKKLKEHQQSKILDIIIMCMLGVYNHKLFNDDRTFSLDNHKILRKISRPNWEKIISPFFVLFTKCADYTEHITDAYKYSERMEIFLENYSCKLSEQALPEVERQITINTKLALKSLNLINNLINNNNISEYNRIFKPNKRLNSTEQLKSRRDLFIILLENSITKEYKEATTGRLFQKSDANLQSCPGEIRKIFVSGLGNYDYDIQNCFYKIIYQLIRIKEEEDEDHPIYKYKLYPEIDYLVNKPQEYREKLSDEWCVPVPTVKQILTSMLNGGAQNHKSDCFKNICPVEELNYQYTRKILDSRRYKDIKKELKRIKEILTKRYVKNGETLKNVAGKILDLKMKKPGKKRNTSKNKIITHIVQGIERNILDVVSEEYFYQMELKIHDGWILNKDIDTKEIESLIKSKTGFDVVIIKKSLNFDLP